MGRGGKRVRLLGYRRKYKEISRLEDKGSYVYYGVWSVEIGVV